MDLTSFSSKVLFLHRVPLCIQLVDLSRNRETDLGGKKAWEEANGDLSGEARLGEAQVVPCPPFPPGQRLTGPVILQVACSWHRPLRPSAQGSISVQLRPSPW